MKEYIQNKVKDEIKKKKKKKRDGETTGNKQNDKVGETTTREKRAF
jgi:hypothetical protein